MLAHLSISISFIEKKHNKWPLLKHETTMEYVCVCTSVVRVCLSLTYSGKSLSVGVWYMCIFFVTCIWFLSYLFVCFFSFFTTWTSHTFTLIKNDEVVLGASKSCFVSSESEECTWGPIPSTYIDENSCRQCVSGDKW